MSQGAQDDAQAVLSRRDRAGLEPSDVGDYEDARDARDTYRTGAFVTLGAGLALGATGAILFAFDTPRVEAPLVEEQERAPGAEPPAEAPGFEVGGTGWVTPGGAGLGLSGRF